MKDALVVGGICALAVLAGAFFYFKGGDLLSMQKEGEVQYSVIAEGTTAGAITARTNYRIQDSEQFFALWKLVYGNEAPNPPAIDFKESEVIAVFDGSHTSGGYRINVLSVVDTGLHRVVTIEHVEPHPDCRVTDAYTSPFEFVVVPEMPETLTISREEITTVSPCS